MNEEHLAEMFEWQARCRDLETANGELREERDRLRTERDTAVKYWHDNVAKNETLWARITELENVLFVATSERDRYRLMAQQGVEL